MKALIPFMAQWDQAYDYFDKASDGVLGNLQKRFVEGAVDWKPFLARMRAYQDKENRKKHRAGMPVLQRRK